MSLLVMQYIYGLAISLAFGREVVFTYPRSLVMSLVGQQPVGKKYSSAGIEEILVKDIFN
jgi:hypothetical protein